MDTADVIRRARIRAGLTKSAVAKRLKVSPAAVTQWENGTHLPSLASRGALARLLNIELRDLIPEARGQALEDQDDLQIEAIVQQLRKLPQPVREAVLLQLRAFSEALERYRGKPEKASTTTDPHLAPSNKLPVNQLAAKWLQVAKEPADPDRSFLAQLAWWGLEHGVQLPEPNHYTHPERHNLEHVIGLLLRSGPKEAAKATEWFLNNPNQPPQENIQYLVGLLKQASSPQEAAQLVLEVMFDRIVAVNATSRE
jgi:transcriptional regulator with XRE-family HTH domain